MDPPRLNLPFIGSAHPIDEFGPPAVDLLRRTTSHPIACVNARGLDASSPMGLAEMVDRIELARQELGIGPWIFWGMSGGGWLAQIYAHRHPHALRGMVIESACPCFHRRLADPKCVLSPLFPAWRNQLSATGLLPNEDDEGSSSSREARWESITGIGEVLRRDGGPALLVAPEPLPPPMKAAIPSFLSFDARPWLSSIRVPTLVLVGGADPLVPVAHARAIHEAVAGSEFVVVDDAGHVPTAQDHPRVAGAFARWVQSSSLRATAD